MSFQSYRGGFNVAAGFKPDGDSGFPLIESCDIQTREDNTRLDAELTQLWQAINNSSGGGSVTPGAAGVGISKIEKTSTSGLVDTYTITLTNGDTSTFTVTNGKDGDPGRYITAIEGPISDGLVDTYTIVLSDGSTSKFTVTNGDPGIDSPLPIEVASEAELDAILAGATEGSIGSVYKYTGTTTDKYEQGELYILTDDLSSEDIGYCHVPQPTKDNAGQILVVDVDGYPVWTPRSSIADTNIVFKKGKKTLRSAINEINEKTLPDYTSDDNSKVLTIEDGAAVWKEGASGKDGTSVTHSWDGTVLTLTSASGTDSIDLQGEPGEAGRGISRVELNNTNGLYKIYKFIYTDGTISTFTVKDGAGLEVVTTEGSAIAYKATVNSITSLTNGATFIMIPHTANSLLPTLNVNNLGTRSIVRKCIQSDGTITTFTITSGFLKAGKPYRMIYEDSYWALADYIMPHSNDLQNPVPIAKGGTGAITAAAALTNLGAQAASDDTLETSAKTVVGAINELHDTLYGNIVGTWVFNDELTFPTTAIEYSVVYEFVYNNTSYKGTWLGVAHLGPPCWAVYFDSTEVSGSIPAVYVEENSYGALSGWKSEFSKAITILEEPTDEAFITWLKANAVKQNPTAFQPKTDYTLETTDKTVAGAINEINGKTIDKIPHIDTWYGAVQGLEELHNSENDKIGFGWRDEYAFMTEDGEVISEGTISHRIPIVAGDNVTLTVDEANQVVKINAEGGGSSIKTLIGSEGLEYTESKDGTYAICKGLGTCTDSNIKIASHYNGLPVEEIANEAFSGAHFDIRRIVSITVPNSVKTIGTYFVEYCANLRSVFIPKSVTFIDEFAFIIKDAPTYIYFEADSQPSEWNKNWMGDLTKDNIIWGYNPEYDENGNFVMPQIRFVGMPCEGWLGQVDWGQVNGDGQKKTNENLKFTIEIVGGGALQVGDTLQICRMSSYGSVDGVMGVKSTKPKKRKLRRLFEYVITKADLNKRFITFEVPYNADKKAIKLFTKWATSGVNDKSIYFRIRRPKGEINSGDNGGGMTVDAQFSNVVSVRCLSYSYCWTSAETGEDVYFYQIRIT